MKIRMPAVRKVSMTPGISGRGGSTMPTRPTSVNPDLAWLNISFSNDVGGIPRGKMELEIAFRASNRTLRP